MGGIGLAALLTPAPAAACAPSPASAHCYGEAEWNVERLSGSGFKGLDVLLGINSEALYEYNGTNLISNEAWVGFKGNAYWNESGEILGCVRIIGCTPEHEDRFFWYQNTVKTGEGGALSAEGNKGPEEYEVTDKYYAPTNGWYVKAGTLTGGVNGNPASATSITAGVETTSASALNSAGARNLDWEDLKEKWHFSNWSSGSGHAEITCNSPAEAVWDTRYAVFSFGVNIGIGCTRGADALAPPTISPSLRPAGADAAAITPNFSATSTMTTAELRSRVLAISASLGDAAPSSIEMVQGSRASTVAAATPSVWFSETPEQQQWLAGLTFGVVVHGSFESVGSAPGQSPSQAKPYTTLGLVVDARTGAVTTFNLSEPDQQQPALGGVGHVSTL
jgi:hypothetical protein